MPLQKHGQTQPSILPAGRPASQRPFVQPSSGPESLALTFVLRFCEGECRSLALDGPFSKWNRIVEFTGRHQWSAGFGGSNALHLLKRLAFGGDAAADIARDHRRVDQLNALSKNLHHLVLGPRRDRLAQSTSGNAPSSGKMVSTAPASQGCGSRPVSRNVNSVSQPSAVACSRSALIQANRPAAVNQPSSLSLNLETGVAGGIAPPATISRAATMARGGCPPLPHVVDRLWASERRLCAWRHGHCAQSGFAIAVGATAGAPLAPGAVAAGGGRTLDRRRRRLVELSVALVTRTQHFADHVLVRPRTAVRLLPPRSIRVRPGTSHRESRRATRRPGASRFRRVIVRIDAVASPRRSPAATNA